jgi:hypothetical protein
MCSPAPASLSLRPHQRSALEVLVCEQDPVLDLKLKGLQIRLKTDMVKVRRGDGVENLLRRA